jgi:hypothetical protein
MDFWRKFAKFAGKNIVGVGILQVASFLDKVGVSLSQIIEKAF